MSSMLTIRIYNGLGTIILRQKETLEELILVNGNNDDKDKSNYGLKINTVIDPKQGIYFTSSESWILIINLYTSILSC